MTTSMIHQSVSESATVFCVMKLCFVVCYCKLSAAKINLNLLDLHFLFVGHWIYFCIKTHIICVSKAVFLGCGAGQSDGCLVVQFHLKCDHCCVSVQQASLETF